MTFSFVSYELRCCRRRLPTLIVCSIEPSIPRMNPASSRPDMTEYD